MPGVPNSLLAGNVAIVGTGGGLGSAEPTIMWQENWGGQDEPEKVSGWGETDHAHAWTRRH